MRIHAAALSLLLFAGAGASAQSIPGRGFSNFVQGNEKFGRKLLADLHAASPDQNIAVSPLPVSLSFAPLEEHAVSAGAREQIRTAFEWTNTGWKGPSTRMLMARFAKPGNAEKPPGDPPRSIVRKFLAGGAPEANWLTVAFLYREKNVVPESFVNQVQEDFGLPMVRVGATEAEKTILDRNWDAGAPRPQAIGEKDFWITSATHLRTMWAANTFISGRRKIDFHLRSGERKEIEVMKGELNAYRYAKTEQFEAIVLPGITAYLLVVMPGEGQPIGDLARALALDVEFADAAMKREIGKVDLPPFWFEFETDLRGPLERMGVQEVFSVTQSMEPMVPSAGGVLTGVVQKVEIAVDETGIRADAGTMVGGVYGGIMQPPKEPFHMVVDRPFLFFIRDNVTNALLFAGIVVDPTRH